MILGWLPKDVSTFGPSIDSTLRFIVYVVGTFFVLAEGAIVFFLISSRRKAGERAHYIDGETLGQLKWILIPVLIVVCFDVAIDTMAAPIWDSVKRDIPEGVITVRVRGVQFGWEFTYAGPDGKFGGPNEFTQTNTLTVPTNSKIRLIITSKDVIHSFYVPVLRLKQDAVPGREIPAWFEVTEEGKYEIACSQLCGVSHFAMKGILLAESPDKFQQWLSEHRQKAVPQTQGASNTGLPEHKRKG